MGTMNSARSTRQTPSLSESNTWEQSQVFQGGILIEDGQSIGVNNGGVMTVPVGATLEIAGTLDCLATVSARGAFFHRGSTLGFYDTAPIAKQTGVAVSAGGVHAALVALGLISA